MKAILRIICYVRLTSFFIIVPSVYALAQDINVVGKVISSEDQKPLSQVSIMIEGTTRGALSSDDGSFNLSAKNGDYLIFKSVGFDSVRLQATPIMTVIMSPNYIAGTEVVVIGYGRQQRKDVTSAISSISGEQLKEMPVGNINMALQSRIPGLQITSSGNQPGAGSMARIRGINSINVSNGPLYVIDGVITTGDIREINPEDVESIDVLKDASAAAIYGARAAEGVIIITTKKGARGIASINYSGYFGMQKPVKTFDFINGKEYEMLRRLAYYDESGEILMLHDTTATKRFDNQLFNAMELQSIREGKSYDWVSQILQNAPIHNHTISVSNGNERSRLYISGNYYSQDGIIKNSNLTRYSLNASGETQISQKLKAILNTNISYVDNRLLNQQIYYNALTMSPLMPYSDSSGQSSVYQDPTKGTLFIINNPEVLTKFPTYKNDDRVLGNLALEYRIIKDLLYRTSFSADIYNSKNYLYAPRNVNINGSYTLGGYGSLQNFSYRDYTFENTLNYLYNPGTHHSLNALAGFTFEKRRQEFNYMTGTGFPSDKTSYKDMSLATKRTIGSSFHNWALTSQLARVIYKFKDRYILNATIRRDGSSYFGENNRYGIFPSVSAAWRLIDEPFMNDIKLKAAVTDIKFRMSYGVIGNYNRTYNAIYSAMSSSGYPFDGNTVVKGYQINTSYLANKDLRWEQQHQFNVGVDLAFLNNRISFVADYYNKNIKDLLLDLPLPMSSAYINQTINIAKMNTKGVDLQLKLHMVKSNSFNWQTEFNFSVFKSQITELLPGIDSLRPDLKVGEAPNSLLIDYVYDGIYQEGTADSVIMKTLGVKPGSLKIKDLNNDGKINPYDMTIVGRTTPTGWGGIWNYMNYKGASLTIFANYMFGHSIFNKAYQDYLYSDGRRLAIKEGLNFWTKEVKDVNGNIIVKENNSTDIPRPNAFGNATKTSPTGTSSFAVQRGDYIRIRNITLGYDLPAKVTEKMKVGSMNIYIQFLEPFLFTKYKGVDPEISQISTGTWSGSSYELYPRYKTTSLGLRVGF